MEKCSFGQRRSVEAATVSFHQTRLHGIQECIRLSVTAVKAKKKKKKKTERESDRERNEVAEGVVSQAQALLNQVKRT